MQSTSTQEDRRLGFIGIVIEDRERSAATVNETLSRYGDRIIGRMGLPYRERNVNVITVIVDMQNDEMGELTGRLGSLPGVTVRAALAKNS